MLRTVIILLITNTQETEILYKTYALSGALAVSTAFLFVSGFSAIASKNMDEKWVSLWNTSLILGLILSSLILVISNLNMFFGIGLIVSGYSTSPWRVRLNGKSNYLYLFSALYSISLLLSFYFQLPIICLITIILFIIQLKIEAYEILELPQYVKEIILHFKNPDSKNFFLQDFVNNFSTNFNQLILGILPEKIFFSISILIKIQLILNNLLYSFIRQYLFGNQKLSTLFISVKQILAVYIFNFTGYYAAVLFFKVPLSTALLGGLLSTLIFIAHFFKDRYFWPNPKPLSELIGYLSGTIILLCIFFFQESQLISLFFSLWMSAQLIRHIIAKTHAKYFS